MKQEYRHWVKGKQCIQCEVVYMPSAQNPLGMCGFISVGISWKTVCNRNQRVKAKCKNSVNRNA